MKRYFFPSTLCGLTMLATTWALPAQLSPPAAANEPLTYREFSPSGLYHIDMFPPHGDIAAFGRCQSRFSGETLWYINWYAPGIALANDGEHLVHYGSAIHSGKLASKPTSVLSFHRRGKLIKEYSLEDLQKNHPPGVSGNKKGPSVRARLAGVNGFLDQCNSFQVFLSDGSLLTFQVRTGELIARGVRPPESKVIPNALPGCLGYRQVLPARVFARKNRPFAQRLYADLASTGKGQNLVLSPSDLATNLLLVATGARGKTEQELYAALLGSGRPEAPEQVIDTLAAFHAAAGLADLGQARLPSSYYLNGLQVTPRPPSGLEVTSLGQGAPLRGWLREGDRIQKVANKPPATIADLAAALAGGMENLPLTLVRPGVPSPLTVILPLRPATLLQSSVALWLGQDAKVLSDFEARLSRFRPGLIHQVDFRDPVRAAQQINAFVALASRNTLGEFFDASMVHQAEIVLTSASYLSAPWKLPFQRLAELQSFQIVPDQSVKAPMMQRTDYYRLLPQVDYDLLELPFQGDRVSLLILLPDVNTTLEEAETLLTTQNLDDWLAELDGVRRRPVEVTLPVFDIKGRRLSLGGSLRKLGVQAAFSSGQADFSGLSDQVELKLADVNHQTFFKVDEKGVEAAAATSTALVPRDGLKEPVRDFRADRPFLFFVRDRASNGILFLGRVIDPTK